MRPTIQDLCGMTTKGLQTKTKLNADMTIIAGLKMERIKLAEDIRDSRFDEDVTYEELAGAQMRLKYLDKAINARTQDIEEMMG